MVVVSVVFALVWCRLAHASVNSEVDDLIGSINASNRASEWRNLLNQIAISTQSSLTYEAMTERLEAYKADSSMQSWLRSQEKQIAKDLNGRSGFNKEDEVMKRFLHDVLIRVALRDPSRGYVQGMNFVAHTLKLVGDFEENYVFYGVMMFVDSIGPEYYTPSMTGVLTDLQLILGPENVVVPKENSPSFVSNFWKVLSEFFQPIFSQSFGDFDGETPSGLQSLLSCWLPSFLVTAVSDKERLIRFWDAILVYQRPGFLRLVQVLVNPPQCDVFEGDRKFFCIRDFPSRVAVEDVMKDVNLGLSWELVSAVIDDESKSFR